MKRPNCFISVFLVLCLLLQPFIPVLATATSQSDDVSSAIEQFNETYEKIKAMEPIDLGLLGTGAVGIVGFFKGEDYTGEVKRANEQIEKAKEQAEEMKKQFDSAKVDDVQNMDVNKLSGSLREQMQASANNQKILKNCGESLLKVSEVLNTIGTVLSILNPILEIVGSICSVPPLTPVGAVAEGILLVTRPLAVAVPIIGATIKGAGDGLIDAAEASAAADKALLTTGESSGPIKVSNYVGKEMVKDGATAGACAFIGSKACGKVVENGASKLATTKVGNSIVTKFMGSNADDFAKGIKNVWGWSSDSPASEMTREVLEDSLTKYLPDGMSAKNVDRFFKNATSIAGKVDSKLYKMATGESKQSISTKGIAKNIAGKGVDAFVDGVSSLGEGNNDVGQPDTADFNTDGGDIE